MRSSFHPFSWMKEPNFESGVARSGVKGPLIVGSSSERFYYSTVNQHIAMKGGAQGTRTTSMTSSYCASLSAAR